MQILERFRVADADRFAWGHLVKGWIKGEVPKPESIAALRAQCDERGISISIPDYVTDVKFMQYEKNVLSVRLPPKELVESGERNITEREAGYPLPSFYERFFNSPTAKNTITREEKLELHAARVGEYTVNACM